MPRPRAPDDSPRLPVMCWSRETNPFCTATSLQRLSLSKSWLSPLSSPFTKAGCPRSRCHPRSPKLAVPVRQSWLSPFESWLSPFAFVDHPSEHDRSGSRCSAARYAIRMWTCCPVVVEYAVAEGAGRIPWRTCRTDDACRLARRHGPGGDFVNRRLGVYDRVASPASGCASTGFGWAGRPVPESI